MELRTSGGPVDVCVVGRDGSIVVVECKLASSSERRRMVIGQVIDYAAAIWMAGADAFIESWLRCTQVDLVAELDDSGLAALRTNIADARIHLCLAVDEIGADLRRLVEYLNQVTGPEGRVTSLQLSYAKHGDLEKERTHLENALETVRMSGTEAEVHNLEEKVTALEGAIVRNDYRAAHIRAGYVYVISNRGALGPGIVKIGLTRRLDPSVRARELGGASVPFKFDVHALYFSEDAVTLEKELHHAFADRRVNMANQRKEFFFVSPGEVKEVLQQKVGNLLEFTNRPEPTEYLQSLKYWPEDE